MIKKNSFKLKTKKLAISAAAAALLAASPARAVVVVEDFGLYTLLTTVSVPAIVTAITTATTTLTTAISTGVGSIVTAITANTTEVYQLGVGIKGSNSAQMQMLKETTETAINAGNKRQAEFQLDMARDRYTITDPCAVGAITNGVSDVFNGVAGISSSYGRVGAGPRHGGSGSGNSGKAQLGNILDIANGKTAAPSPEVASAMAATAGCSNFASGGQRASDCVAAGIGVSSNTLYPNADVNAQTLFDGVQKAGDPKKKYTMNMTHGSDEEIAVSSFLRNINTPESLRALGPGELSTPAGRRYMALRDTYDARMSFAERPSARHIASMTQTKATIDSLKDMTAEGDQYVINYLNKNVPNWQTKGVSADELMNIDVERRYLNIKWQAELEKMASVEQIGREQLRISAQHSLLLWKSIQEQRETNLLLGALLGSNVRNELMPTLRAAHQAATR